VCSRPPVLAWWPSWSCSSFSSRSAAAVEFRRQPRLDCRPARNPPRHLDRRWARTPGVEPVAEPAAPKSCRLVVCLPFRFA
jgi:hypothetical protein